MKRLLVIAILAAVAVSAQEPAPDRSDKVAVDRLFREWREAIAASDADKLADLVTDDVEFWGENTPGIVGKDAVIASFKDTFSQWDLRQSFEEKERIWDESFVIMRGIESTKIAPKGILKSNELRRRVFVIARRGDDGRWRIARGMSNTPPSIR